VGLHYEDDLVAGYAVWAIDANEQASVVLKDGNSSSATDVVSPMVFAYGWDSRFIIAKQHPRKDHFKGIDESVTNWYVITVESGVVHGPLSEEEFNRARMQLRMPQELTFTKTIGLPHSRLRRNDR